MLAAFFESDVVIDLVTSHEGQSESICMFHICLPRTSDFGYGHFREKTIH